MENVVVLTFRDLEPAREAARELQRLHDEHRLRLAAAAVVERGADGVIAVHQLDENRTLLTTGAGGAIGAVLGVFTGPLGIIAGAATGAVVGSLVDTARAEDSTGIVHSMSRVVPPGSSAVIAVVVEPTSSRLDQLANESGATVFRRNRSEVELAIAAAEEAVVAAREASHNQSVGERLRDVKNALTGKE